MTQSEDAWQAGYAAGAVGLPMSRCPAPAGTIESWSWHSGFIEGKAQRGKENNQ
jgi:ribosome modulation factor